MPSKIVFLGASKLASAKTPLLNPYYRLHGIRKTREGWNCGLQKKNTSRKVGTRSRQCRPEVPGRFAFPGARNPRICSISRFVKARFLQCGFWAAKLPNSDLNFAVEFLVDFSSFFFQGKRPKKKIHRKIPRKIHPGTLFGKIPLGFLQKPFLDDSGKFFQQFSRHLPGVFLENSRTDPGKSHSLLEFSEKRKFWGRISRGRPHGYPGRRRGAKASVRPSKSWKKKNKHCGADVHDPKARTSMSPGGVLKYFGQKSFGLKLSFPGYEANFVCPTKVLS